MRQPFFFLLFISGVAFGQNVPGSFQDNLNLNLWKNSSKEKELQAFQKKLFLIQNFQDKEGLQQIPTNYLHVQSDMEGKFSHSISNGAVYSLPIDHMSCLVPDLSKIEKMSTTMQLAYSDGMPIAGPRYRLSPPGKLIK